MPCELDFRDCPRRGHRRIAAEGLFDLITGMHEDRSALVRQIDPARDYAERRGITFRARVAEIVRKVVPEKVRGMFDGMRLPADGEQGPERAAPSPGAGEAQGPVRESAAAKVRRTTDAPERAAAADPDEALRKARTKALIRHARALDVILATGDADGRGSPAQVRELTDARKPFEKVRPLSWRDAEAAYAKNPELTHEAATGRVNRAIRALQLETEIRTDPSRRADRFVERWQKLDRASQHQYQAGDMSGYKATRSAMGDMAKSLERDPQMESLLANRKAALGIDMEAGRRLGAALALSHGLDLGRGRGLGL
ncbi:hypothetical protein LCGC14_0352430 [marine sediment metagenome]|uniref:Uncharacterized protein n=1 Tax=marine sediment metagenome TaxID=412755 RepID=A0A0F9WIH3_9ZZZZ